MGDLALGLVKSKITIALVIAGFAVGALYAISLLAFSYCPPAWMVAATAVGGFVLGLLLQQLGKGWQQTQFEGATLGRLRNEKNYDVIIEVQTPYGLRKIILGALPNRLSGDGERLANEEEVGAVLSLNESWELDAYGLSDPYHQKDWEELGITYKAMKVKDHSLLDNQQLDGAADFIHEQLSKGKNVYVHCRAGHGRSAMGVAGYLLKHQPGNNAKGVADFIQERRPSSTIHKKIARLSDYQQSCPKIQS